MAATLQQTNFAVEQGDTLQFVLGPVTLRDPVTNVVSPIDLTVAQTQITLTAKTSSGVADPGTFQKTIGVGIVANTPATADKNYATITIDPADTDAITGTLPANLLYDVQLREPSGRKTTLARGTITVSPDITNA